MIVYALVGMALACWAGAMTAWALSMTALTKRQEYELADLRGRLAAYYPHNVRPSAEWATSPRDPEEGVQYLMDAAGTGLMQERVD